MVNRVGSFIMKYVSNVLNLHRDDNSSTSVGTEGCNSLVGLTLEIETPSLIRAYDGSLPLLNKDIVLALNRLSIEDEERNRFVGFPAV